MLDGQGHSEEEARRAHQDGVARIAVAQAAAGAHGAYAPLPPPPRAAAHRHAQGSAPPPHTLFTLIYLTTLFLFTNY